MIERFLTPDLNSITEPEEKELLHEFNQIQIHEMDIFYQNNPAIGTDGKFDKEGIRIDGAYHGDCLRIYSCNDIYSFVKELDRLNDQESNKNTEIMEQVEELQRHQLLNRKEPTNVENIGSL